MSSRQALDSKASGIMFGLCILWGLQQVVLKLAAPDISAVMQIALRSGLSALMVYPMIKLAKGTSLWGRDYLAAGILVGLLFAAEFFWSLKLYVLPPRRIPWFCCIPRLFL